jgi:hypothetical protein
MGKRAVSEKKEAGDKFVLPAITTMCTYNVRDFGPTYGPLC